MKDQLSTAPIRDLIKTHETHNLKILTEPFEAVKAGRKQFEFRSNTDRKFQPGDLLILEQWDDNYGYLGAAVTARITYQITGPAFGIPEGYTCMSIQLEDVLR